MTLNDRIKELEKLVETLETKILILTGNTEEKKPTPHSKIAPQPKLTNMRLLFHNGYWKTYAIYKDDEEPEV